MTTRLLGKFLLPVLGLLTLGWLIAVPGMSRAVARSIQATIIEVTTTQDELNNDGDCSLREAVRAANLDTAVDGCPAGTGSDTIRLGSETYLLDVAGTDEDDALTGDLDIKSVVTIVGSGADETIIDGQEIDRVFHVLSTYQLNISRLTIQNGYASSAGLYGGGGILNEKGDIEVYDLALRDNQANKTGGGIDNSGTALLNNVTIDNNSSSKGGGMFNDGTLTLSNGTLSGNSASDRGGGLDNDGDATLTNVTLSGNTADQEGGGLNNTDEVTLLNCTVTLNSSGVYNTLILRVKNTILASNTSYNCAGTITSQGNNLDSGQTCNFPSGGNDLSDADPLLSPLQDNEGPTFTHALLDDSPAIDAGDNDDCPATDQRGAFRPADGDENGTETCDIGTYEYAGSFPVPVFLPLVVH